MDRTATVRAEKNTVPELPAAPGSLPRDEVVGKTQVVAPDDGLEKTLAPANLQARWVQSLKKEIMEGVGSAVQQELRTFREDITEALGSVKAEVQVFHRDWAKESEAHPAASRSSASGKGSQSAPAERESVDQSEVLRAIRESRTVMVSALESVRSQLEDAREDIRAGEAPRERRAPEDASDVLRALREHESKLDVDVAAILRAVRQTKVDVVQLVKDASQAQADLRPVLEGIEEVRAQVDLNRTLAAVQAGVDAVGEVRRDLGAARREDFDGPTRRGPASEPKAVSCEPVLMAIAELRQELSLLKGVRGGRAETSVDLKPLMALVQALDDKTEVEASRVVQAIEELRAHVDPTPVLAAIESVQETDLQRIQASLHEVRRELDQCVLAAIHGCRNEAKADLQPVLAEIRRFREEVDFKRVLAAIRDSRKEDVDYGPLITAVADTVTESVGELRLAIGQSESASAKGMRETGEKWNEFQSVVKTALQGVRGEVAFKIEELGPRLDAVHEAIREMTGELSESLEAALGASRAELQRASLEPLATVVQDVRKEVDLRRTLDFIAASRAEEVDMRPVLASLSELRCQIGEIQATVGMGPSQYQVDLQVLHTAIADMQVDLSPVLHAIRESEAVQETKTEAGFTRTLAAMAEGRRDAETQAAALRETMSMARVDLGQALDKAAVRAGDDVLALKADLRKAVGQATGQARVEISGLKADLGQTVDQLKAELGKALGAEVARLNIDLTQVVGQAAGKVSGEVSSLKVDLGQAVGVAAGRVIAEVSHLKADLSQAVDSAAAKTGDEISRLQAADLSLLAADLSKTVGEAAGSVSEEVSRLRADLSQAVGNASLKASAETLGLKSDLGKAVGLAAGKVRVDIADLKDDIAQAVDQLKADLGEALSAEVSGLNANLTKVVGEAAGKVSGEVSGVKTELGQALGAENHCLFSLQSEVSSLKADLSKVVGEATGKVSAEVSDLKADLRQSVDQGVVKMSAEVSLLRTDPLWSDDISGLKADLIQALDNASAKTGDDISGLRADLSQAVDNASAKTGDNISGLKADLSQAVDSAAAKRGDDISSLKVDLGQALDNAVAKTGEEVLGLKAELRNAIGQATGQARVEISGLKADLGQTVEQLRTELCEALGAEIARLNVDLTQVVGEATSKVSEEVSEIKDDLGQSLVEAAGKVEGVGTQTAMVLAAISAAKTDIGAQVAEVLQVAREIPDNIDQSCVLQAIRESAAAVEPVDLTPVLVQLREGSAETKAALHSVVSSVRESGAEVLHAVVQSKKESDFAMLRTTRDHKAEVDVVPLMQAIQDGKTDVDLSALMASFKHSSRLVDLKPVLSAIQRSRADVDFATALAAAVHLAKVVTACEGLAAFKDQQPLVGGSMVASSSMTHANTYSGPPSPSGSSRFIPSALKSVLKK